MSETIKTKEARESMSYEDLANELKSSDEHIKMTREDAAKRLLEGDSTESVVSTLQDVQELEGYSMALEQEIENSLKEVAPFESDDSNAAYNRLLDEYDLRDEGKVDHVAEDATSEEVNEKVSGQSLDTEVVDTNNGSEVKTEEAEATEKIVEDSTKEDTIAEKILKQRGIPTNFIYGNSQSENNDRVAVEVEELKTQAETPSSESTEEVYTSDIDLNNLSSDPERQAIDDKYNLEKHTDAELKSTDEPKVEDKNEVSSGGDENLANSDSQSGTGESVRDNDYKPGWFEQRLGNLFSKRGETSQDKEPSYKGKHRKLGRFAWLRFSNKPETVKEEPKIEEYYRGIDITNFQVPEKRQDSKDI